MSTSPPCTYSSPTASHVVLTSVGPASSSLHHAQPSRPSPQSCRPPQQMPMVPDRTLGVPRDRRLPALLTSVTTSSAAQASGGVLCALANCCTRMHRTRGPGARAIRSLKERARRRFSIESPAGLRSPFRLSSSHWGATQHIGMEQRSSQPPTTNSASASQLAVLASPGRILPAL